MPVAVRPRARMVFTALLITLLAMIANPAPAAAHAVLLSTTPGGWQLLGDSPGEVSLRFSEPVDLGLASVRVIGPSGKDVTGIGKPEHPDGKQDTITVRVGETLPNGTHTVAWRVVSADTHPVQGAFTFSVREATAPAAVGAGGDQGGDGTVTVLYGLSRWLATAGLALLVGTTFVAAVCWPALAARRGGRGLAVVGLAATAAATVLALLLYGPYASGRSLGSLADPGLIGTTLGSRIGLSLAARLLLLAAAAVLIVRFWRQEHAEGDLPRRTRTRRGAVVLGGAVALAATWSLVAHGAAGGLAPLSVPVDIAHLTAASVWLGGLPALAVLLRSGDANAMKIAVPRFSTIAGVCVAVVVVTGLYQTWRQVGTVSALFGTTYGWYLLGKVAIVAVLLASGALARRWVRGHYGFEVVTVTDKRKAKRAPETGEVGRFRKLVMAEVAIGALLLTVTVSLVGTEPARAEQDRERNPPQAGAAEGPVSLAIPFDAGGLNGKGQVAFVLTPAKVGPNQLHLVVLDPAGQSKNVPEVRADLRLPSANIGPISVPLVSGGPSHYISSEIAMPMAGQWELAVVVRTSAIDQTTVRVPVNTR
ncbi:copper resistance CopC/CopD family protein [Actinokineospora iranica]|uniref:Copper transport protein n=1 Tax=Actinokineospora iranica TaxID=1271860 RepID=A0A1G6XDQ5_9PSEU|nr:copper resistance protein CopC [Actinokineospora iranica]SDD76182.1 copper transport protein [Actinokineospora iranica]